MIPTDQQGILLLKQITKKTWECNYNWSLSVSVLGLVWGSPTISVFLKKKKNTEQ